MAPVFDDTGMTAVADADVSTNSSSCQCPSSGDDFDLTSYIKGALVLGFLFSIVLISIFYFIRSIKIPALCADRRDPAARNSLKEHSHSHVLQGVVGDSGEEVTSDGTQARAAPPVLVQFSPARNMRVAREPLPYVTPVSIHRLTTPTHIRDGSITLSESDFMNVRFNYLP